MNINRGRFVLVNETSGNVCCVDSYRARYNASESVCQRVKRELSRKFPVCTYAVYRLVRLNG